MPRLRIFNALSVHRGMMGEKLSHWESSNLCSSGGTGLLPKVSETPQNQRSNSDMNQNGKLYSAIVSIPFYLHLLRTVVRLQWKSHFNHGLILLLCFYLLKKKKWNIDSSFPVKNAAAVFGSVGVWWFCAQFPLKDHYMFTAIDPFSHNEDSHCVAARYYTVNLFCKPCMVPQPCIFDTISISSIIHGDKPLIYRQVGTDQVNRDTGFYKVHLQNSTP